MISENDISQLSVVMEYLRQVPFDVSQDHLYSAKELYRGYDPNNEGSFESCFDSVVYRHYISKGKQLSGVLESLARKLHDHGIHAALNEFFQTHDHRSCLGLMGGHAQLRTDINYRDIVFLSKRLTEQGFYMLSGGGPGAMEATHLGAWMAGRTEDEVADALECLAEAPSYKDAHWLSTAWKVIEKYPQNQFVSLGIPTWLYGHEPSTPFATHIAKFFENSIREDSILTLAFGGIIYTPGSAGTLQEIFQDAVQNHYLSFGFASPMVFVGKDFWTKEVPVYPLLESLTQKGRYKNLILSISDNNDEIIQQLLNFQKNSHI